jgi:predicted nucleic acid-binding protein
MGRGVVTESPLCLDTGVWVKFLVVEEPIVESQTATHLVNRGLRGARLVAPSFAWAEVGSVLRKKARQGHLSGVQAGRLWAAFCDLPIEYLNEESLQRRAWEVAERYSLATLYDAAFMACTELAGDAGTTSEFWTADRELVRTLGGQRPSYVRELR